MSQLDNIKAELNQTYDTNIFRIGLIADSIWSPVGDDVETDGSHPPYRMKKNSFYRQIWDYLNYNKPTFRSIEHTDWAHTGSSEVNGVYPQTGNLDDKIRLLNSDSDISVIQITGHETAVIWFEGGESGRTYDTGTVTIEVSTNGVDYVSPSTMGLSGKKQTGRINDTLGYDTVIDELDTNIVFPSYPLRAIINNSYISYREIQYNGLNTETTYYFRITRKTGTNAIRLGGAYYFTGKTCIMMSFTLPGASQDYLISQYLNTIAIHDMNFMLFQSTIYHDFWDDSELDYYMKNIITKAKRYCTRLVYCSCTPAAVVVEDAETEQGDEQPSYFQGQNLQKENNNAYAWNIDAVTWANYPQRGAVYRITINTVEYDLSTMLGRVSEEDFPGWGYEDVVIGLNYEDFPVDDISYPATLTKISGDGAATLTINSRFWTPRGCFDTRDLIKSKANRLGVQFVDLFQVFQNIAIANGETVETDGYPITPSSPLYSEYPTGYENYLSRYFRPNHWRPAANAPVYQKLISDVFTNFKFD